MKPEIKKCRGYQQGTTNRYDFVSESQQRAVFKTLLESSLVAVVYIDIKGDVVTCNPAFESLFGYSLDEMIGNNIDFFITNKETYAEACSLTALAGKSEVLRMRSIRYHRNGSRVDVESQGMPVFVCGKAVGILAQYYDATHLKNAERVASDLYTSFKLLLDSIDADVYVSDLVTHELLFMNKHMKDSFGPELIGKKCYAEFRHLPGPCPHCTNNQLVNADGSPSAGVIWEGKNPVTGRWYKNSDRAVFWNDNRLVRLQIATDITDIKEAEKKMEHLATHDALTGLPNRALFHDRLDHALKINKRNKSAFAVMFLDLDNFKNINDTFGHLAGDQVLQETAMRLQHCIRKSDTIARESGDEFTFIIEHFETSEDHVFVSNRILESLSSPYILDEITVNLSCSIGVSLFPEHGSDIDSLLNNADFAMYKAKSMGGNCVICYTAQEQRAVPLPTQNIMTTGARSMFFVDEPYISSFLKTTLLDNAIPVVATEAAKKLGLLPGTNWISEAQAVELAHQPGELCIYTASENSIGWIAQHLAFSTLPGKIELFKNKAKFRELTHPLSPDFFFKEVAVQDLPYLQVSELPLPFIIKPTAGFFSMGVHKVSNPGEWETALASIQAEIGQIEGLYPQEVLNINFFIIEEIIEGEEFAVDAYLNTMGKPVILSIYRHPFSSTADVGDRIYTTSKEIVEKNLAEFTTFVGEMGRLAELRNFPMHIELRRREDGRLLPIEVNPMRFGGWCSTADLTCAAYGFNPYLTYIRGEEPDWAKLLAGKDGKLFSMVVLNNSTGFPSDRILSFDFDGLLSTFEKPLELRRIDHRKYHVFGFLFAETRADNHSELDVVLRSDLKEFVRIEGEEDIV